MRVLKKNEILIILTSVIIVFYFYSNILIAPNSYMFNDTGDGIKNYYTYAYHIKNDSSFTELEGMNYPYGEHFFYTDGHPIISIIVKSISKFIPSITGYSIGIINYLMILSIFFTYIIIYYVLIKFKIKPIIAFVGAVSIGLLEPQIFRMTGHYALSYGIAIPLTWLILLRYKENLKLSCLFVMAINNMFWLLIHAYLGIIIIGFVAFYFLIEIILDIKNLKKYLAIIITVLLPIIIFELILILTDNHVDRTNNPSGFFLYNAELDDILLPHEKMGFYRSFLDSFVKINQKWEGWAYIGFFGSLFFVYFVFSFIYYLIKRNLNLFKSRYFDNVILSISLLSSLILLVFSFGVPFKQYPLLLEFFSIFKQFRATGRFDWVFYFVFLTFGFYMLNKLYVSLLSKNKYLAYSLITLVFLGYIYEGGFQQNYMSKQININKNVFLPNYKNNLTPSVLMVEFDKYQAIIPMPFYHFGSEVFSVAGKLNTERISILYSYHFGIPMLSAYLTRVSIPESKKIISFLAPTYYKKELANEITKTDKFLIIESDNAKTKYENEIIARSEFIFSLNGFNFYEITPDKLFEYTAKEDITNFYEKKDSLLIYKNGFYVSDTSKYFYYNSFDDLPCKISFRGKGSGLVKKNTQKIIADFTSETFTENTEYNLSLWAYNADNNLNEHFRFGLIEYNKNGIVWEQEFYPELSQLINGDWSLVEFDFTIKNKSDKLKLYTKGSVYSYGNIIFDDLFVCEKPLDVYKEIKKNKELFFNNHQIK